VLAVPYRYQSVSRTGIDNLQTEDTVVRPTPIIRPGRMDLGGAGLKTIFPWEFKELRKFDLETRRQSFVVKDSGEDGLR